MSKPPVHRGMNHWNHKLNPVKVRQIRSIYARGGVTQEQIGLDFGVNQDTVSRIVRRTIWRCVA